MKRTIITVILTLALTAFAIQAVEQTAFSGAGVIESTNGGFKFPDGTVQTSAAFSLALSIGDTGPAGGIVFHVSDDGRHGLEAAQEDQGQLYWRGTTPTNAAKEGINGGSFNTDRIISTLGSREYGFDYAALAAANYNGGGYGDWYLPSKDELALMYDNLHLAGLGSFAGSLYWSSSEGDNVNAWAQAFANGTQFTTDKLNNRYVRAIRAF